VQAARIAEDAERYCLLPESALAIYKVRKLFPF